MVRWAAPMPALLTHALSGAMSAAALTAAVIDSCYGGFSEEVTFALATVGWGWHINTATHVLRMILGGVFDRHPELRVMVSEGGATWGPFLADRLDEAYRQHATAVRPTLQRLPSEYLYEHVYASFQHDRSAPAALWAMGWQNVCWGSDYPHLEGTFGHTQKTLHELFDDVNEAVAEYVDLIAERVVQLGGIAEGTARIVAGRTTLPDYPLTLRTGAEHVAALSDALAAFGRAARIGIEEMDALEDSDSADLLTEVSRGIDKWLWFVEAHQQGEPITGAR